MSANSIMPACGNILAQGEKVVNEAGGGFFFSGKETVRQVWIPWTWGKYWNRDGDVRPLQVFVQNSLIFASVSVNITISGNLSVFGDVSPSKNMAA